MKLRKLVCPLLLLGMLFSGASAEEKEKNPPDLWTREINLFEEGVGTGETNRLEVVVTNRSKDSDFEGPVKFELVVIQGESRQSYLAEMESMRYKQLKQATIQGIKISPVDPIKFLVILDPQNAIEESNEDNNRYLFQPKRRVGPPPAPESNPSDVVDKAKKVLDTAEKVKSAPKVSVPEAKPMPKAAPPMPGSGEVPPVVKPPVPKP